jgi:hypothetical protein
MSDPIREMEVGLELLESLQAKTGELQARDLSTAIRNLDVGQGIHRTKAAELRGDAPPPIEVNFSVSDQIRSLAARGVKFYDSPTGGDELPPEQAIRGHWGQAALATLFFARRVRRSKPPRRERRPRLALALLCMERNPAGTSFRQPCGIGVIFLGKSHRG